MKRKLSLGSKSTIAYTIASLFSKGIAFITIPVFTRIMTTEQIGIVNIYNSWFSLIYVFSTLSLTSGGYQVALKKFSDKRNEYVSSVVSITIAVAALLLIVFAIADNFFEKIFGLDKCLIFLMGIGLAVSPAMDFWLARQRYEYKYKTAFILSILGAAIATCFSIIMVLYVDNSAKIRLIANFSIIYGIDFAILIYLFLKGKTFFDKKFWTFSLKLGIPMIAYSVSSQVLNVSDRLMINKYIGKRAVGIYGTLYSISTISLILWNAINASFVPYLHNNLKSNPKGIKKLSTVILALYSVCAVMITYFSPEIIRIFATQEYYEAIYIMAPIAAGISLMAISNMYSNILLFYEKTYVIMIASIVAAILNVGLNAWFIPRMGYQAAAYTTMVAYIILASVQAVYVWKNQETQNIYNNKAVFVIAFFCVLACLLGLFLYNRDIIRYFMIGILFVAVFIVTYKMELVNMILKK